MKSRRGISSVVGTVFAIIALASTVGYITYSMNVLDNYNQSVLARSQQATDITKEKFQVSSVTFVNNKLNITVVNTGSLPVNFTKIWITNKSATIATTPPVWVKSYTPTSSIVAPGNTLTNIGQGINTWLNTNYPYHVKLVTSRGNTNEFDVNSASTAPLNIQIRFLPPTVSSGFKSELLMVVINNSTGTLTNVSPSSLPAPTYGSSNSGGLQCTAGSVNPTAYNTLAPGNAAFFTWDVTSANGVGGDTCTYNLTQPLQNGYSQTVSPPTPLTVTAVSLSSTSYSQNSGVVTDDYTSFKWSQGTTWNSDWSFNSGTTTDFKITITNNNQTQGGYKLWLSKNTQMMLFPTIIPANGKVQPTPYFLVNSVSLGPPLGITAYTDNSIGIPNAGGQATIYFGASTAGGSTQTASSSLQAGTPYFGMIVVYGKFTKNSGDTTGGNYAQTIPFLAIISN